jgi:hypothetical protein
MMQRGNLQLPPTDGAARCCPRGSAQRR